MQLLAKSERFKVESEYETVLLTIVATGERVVIGDFYGDPVMALIDRDEKWCAMGGCGVLVYWLRKPFAPYRYDAPSRQYVEFHRSKSDLRWVKWIRQIGPASIELALAGGEKQILDF